MKKLFLLILINLIIVFINAQKQCTLDPDFTYVPPSCDVKSQQFSNPIINIQNFISFDDITITPSPIYTKKQNNLLFQIEFDFNKSYQIVFSKEGCQSFNVPINTDSAPKFEIIQPKCIGSSAFINFIKEVNSNNQLTVNGAMVTSLPYEVVSPDLSTLVQARAYYGETNYCEKDFAVIPQSNNVPQFQIKNIVCGGGKGEISILNYNDYTNIQLLDPSDEVVESYINGIFYDLETQGDYTIILESSLCGTQTFVQSLSLDPPWYHVDIVNDKCPASTEVNVVVETDSPYQLLKGKQPITSPFVLANDEIPILIQMSCGTFAIPIIYPKTTIPAINYIVEETADICQENYNITLLYDPLISQTITVLQKSYDFEVADTSITVENNTFIANINNYYSVSSSCFTEPLYISKPIPKPIYTFLSKSNYCSETVDIYVYNWLDFTSMEISGYSFGEGPVSSTKFLPVNGLFKDVWNVELKLTYQYRNCTTPKSITLGSKNTIDQQDIDVAFKLDRVPTCRYNGNGTFTLMKKNSDHDILAKVDQEFQYNKGYNISFGVDFNPFCSIWLSIDIEPFEYLEANVTVELIKKPTCKYSDDGLIKLNTDTQFRTVTINGYYAGQVIDNTFSVNSGNNTIVVEFDRSTYCSLQTIYYYVEPNDSFDFEYTISNVTDCQVPDGSVQIIGWDSYSQLSLKSFEYGGFVGISPSGAFNQLSSYYYELTFTKDFSNGGSCSGSKIVFVPSAIDVQINYNIIRKPLCAKDTGGTVYFKNIINRLTSQEISISTVLTIDRNYESVIASDLYPGDYQFALISGACGWLTNTITIEESPVNINYHVVFSSYSGKDCYSEPYSGILFSTDNLDAVSSLNIVGYPSGSITDGLLISNSFSNNFGIILSYGQESLCSKTFNFENFISNEIKNRPNPDLEYSIVRYPSCSSMTPTFDIKITDPSKWTVLSIGGITMDSDGIIKNITEYSSISGIISSFDCEYSDMLTDLNLIVTMDIDSTIVNETCFGSTNGELQIKDDQYYYLPTIYNDLFVDIIAPLKSADDLKTFKLITSEQVTIYKINKNLMSCLEAGNPQYVSGKEPILNSLINNQCSPSELGSININPSVDNLSYAFNYSSATSDSPPIPSVNGAINNLQGGNYSISDFKITTDYCKRQFEPFYVNIENSESIKLNISAASICDPLVFTPLIQSTNDLLYQIKTPSEKIVEFTKNGILTIENNQFNESGSYYLTVSKVGDNCKTNLDFQLINCPIIVDSSNDDGKDDNNNNLGLKIGLPIGLSALVAILIVAALLIRKRRRNSPTKVNKLESEKYEKKTIPMYQGGHIVELDKF